MNQLESLLAAFRAFDHSVELGHLSVDVQNAAVTMTTTFFSEVCRAADGTPNPKLLENVARNLRSYINFRRGYRIGAGGLPVVEGDASGLLQRSDIMKGFVVSPEPPHALVLVWSYANDELQGPFPVH